MRCTTLCRPDGFEVYNALDASGILQETIPYGLGQLQPTQTPVDECSHSAADSTAEERGGEGT